MLSGTLMEQEIQEQIPLFSKLAESYAEFFAQSKISVPDFFLLTARGSSDHVATYAKYLFEIHLERPAMLASPSVWTVYNRTLKLPEKTLTLGISQSGSGPDVAEVLRVTGTQGAETLAITNRRESRVSQAAEKVLYLEAGEERSVAATKTCTLSILAIYQLARSLGADLPAPGPFLPNQGWLQECQAAAQSHAAHLLDSNPVFALGRGYTYATALESAIKLMECALVACKGYSAADFHHGPKALAGVGSAIIDFTGTAQEKFQQPATYFNPPGLPEGVPAELSPLWHLIYGQSLALACGRAKGLNPDKPQFIQKVTETL